MRTRRQSISILAIMAALSTISMAQASKATAGLDPALMAKTKAGNADAEFQVGVKYELGASVKKDPAEAAAWYRKAAEHGDVRAQHSLGVLYEFGNGVPK